MPHKAATQAAPWLKNAVVLVGVQKHSCHLAQRQCLFALQAWPLRHHAPCAEDLRSENMTYHTWFHRSWGNQKAESFSIW